MLRKAGDPPGHKTECRCWVCYPSLDLCQSPVGCTFAMFTLSYSRFADVVVVVVVDVLLSLLFIWFVSLFVSLFVCLSVCLFVGWCVCLFDCWLVGSLVGLFLFVVVFLAAVPVSAFAGVWCWCSHHSKCHQ